MDAMHREADKKIAKLEKKLKTQYKKAHTEIEKKLNKYLKQFDKQDKVYKALVKKGQMTKYDYIKWRQHQILMTKGWQEIRDGLAQDYLNAGKQANEIVAKELGDIVAENRDYETYRIEKSTGADTNFYLTDPSTVENLITQEQSIIPQVDASKMNKWNQNKITSAVTQGILQGDSMAGVASRIALVTGMNARAAMRTARTCVTSAENYGRLAGMRRAQDLGIELQKQWLSSRDGRVRHSHRQVDGEIVPINETFGNGCEYPADPLCPPEETYNCRCTMISSVKGHEIPFDMSVSPEFGSYEEWKAGHPTINYSKPKKAATAKKTTAAKATPTKAKKAAQSARERAIKNAKVYDEDFHIKKNFERILEKIHEAERRAIIRYTDFWYDDMNDYLRGIRTAEDVGSDVVNWCKLAHNGLAKAELAEDTLLYRGMGRNRTLARALNITEEELEIAASDGSLIGMRFREKGLCSTGINANKGWDKPVSLEIVAPKGTKGMYVDPISENRGEKEVLLLDNTEFEILEVKDLGYGKKLLRVIITNQ